MTLDYCNGSLPQSSLVTMMAASWLLIGQHTSRDRSTGLSLVNSTSKVTDLNNQDSNSF